MPMYYFHVRDGLETVDDAIGTELSGLGEARSQAIEAAGEILKDKGRHHWTHGIWRMQVTDDRGVTVCQLSFEASCANA